jgi:hypothetical protein
MGLCSRPCAAEDTSLEPITIIAMGVSQMTAASSGDVTSADIASMPLSRPAAVLENVPGLIVTQHSGEGKANQYFLRAFNLDHGTDLALSVDDMPVNMPSHAHGQGYSDLNFLVPELIADIHYKKGPYYADEGDFATAGAARIDLVRQLSPSVTLGLGDDGYRRVLALGDFDLQPGRLLAAAEVYRNDGPFDVSDDYRRLNGVVRYISGGSNDYWTLTAMAYRGLWNATDQVPQRAIDEGLIDRFGTLNPSDGGDSSRDSLSFSRVVRRDSSQTELSAYLIRYELDLWSTFTYFLRDPSNGDQILQHDDRMVYGVKAAETWYGDLFGRAATTVIGVQVRADDIRDVGISSTVDRRTLGASQDASVLESGLGAYLESTWQLAASVRATLGARYDEFAFDVTDKLQIDPQGSDSGDKRSGIFSPKVGLAFGPWRGTSLFLDAGGGYHSNDARGVTRSGNNADAAPVTPLTRAFGAEIGIDQRGGSWDVKLDAFLLKLRSELVFDGDAGVTVPSGATTRFGLEWGGKYRINDWLSAELNAAWTRARFDREAPADDLGCSDASPVYPCADPLRIVGRYVPNSPTSVADAAITAHRPSGWFATVRARHFGSSPLVEDNSAESTPYTTIDLRGGFDSRERWTIALDLFNVANKKWDDIEYYYVSRLNGESNARPDYEVHPGIPRTLRAHFSYRFF